MKSVLSRICEKIIQYMIDLMNPQNYQASQFGRTTFTHNLKMNTGGVWLHSLPPVLGLSPSGKAQDFDSCIHQFESG